MAKPVIGPDGYQRSEQEEARINLAVVTALGDKAGEAVIQYLRSITIEVVAGPKISEAELRHLEGMRFLVGVLSQRIQLGHKVKSNVNDKGE